MDFYNAPLWEFLNNSRVAPLNKCLLSQMFSGDVERKQALDFLQENKADILISKMWSVVALRADAKENAEDVYKSAESLMDSDFDARFPFVAFLRDGNLLIIFKISEEKRLYEIKSAFDDFLAKNPLPISVGIGDAVSSLDDIEHSYFSTMAALDYCMLYGKRVAYMADVNLRDKVKIDAEIINDILKSIKSADGEKIKSAFSAAFDSVKRLNVSPARFRLYISEFLGAIIKIADYYDLDANNIFGADFKGYIDISTYATFEELESDILEICLHASIALMRKKRSASNLITERAKRFIYAHYTEPDISIEKLCNHLHISSAYFSTIFKKETGVSFVAYLTATRMEKAAKLIKCSNEKTYVIAQKVGYAEPNYFSLVFKKYFGVSPSKYKEQNSDD